MKTKTHVKAGGIAPNHNQTLERAQEPTPGLKVKTHVPIWKGETSCTEEELLLR